MSIVGNKWRTECIEIWEDSTGIRLEERHILEICAASHEQFRGVSGDTLIRERFLSATANWLIAEKWPTYGDAPLIGHAVVAVRDPWKLFLGTKEIKVPHKLNRDMIAFGQKPVVFVTVEVGGKKSFRRADKIVVDRKETEKAGDEFMTEFLRRLQAAARQKGIQIAKPE